MPGYTLKNRSQRRAYTCVNELFNRALDRAMGGHLLEAMRLLEHLLALDESHAGARRLLLRLYGDHWGWQEHPAPVAG